MNRRDFLRALPALAIAPAIPAALPVVAAAPAFGFVETWRFIPSDFLNQPYGAFIEITPGTPSRN